MIELMVISETGKKRTIQVVSLKHAYRLVNRLINDNNRIAGIIASAAVVLVDGINTNLFQL